MAIANSVVARANRPQPSVPQKPHGESSTRPSGAALDATNRGLTAGTSKVAIIKDITAIPVMQLVAYLCRPAQGDRTACIRRREASVPLDRQPDEDQSGEEHQGSNVQGQAQCRISLFRRAIDCSKQAQSDSDQVDETGREHAEANDHVDPRR